MTDGYSRLFSQGLMFHAHPAAPSVLQPPAIIEPVHSSTRTGQIHRRRRSSITVEGSTSPISLLRSPSRAAAQAFSRLLKSPSSRAGDHPVRRVPAQAPKLERPRLVFLPPRAKPAPNMPVPQPPGSPAPSTLSNHSFLTLERTPSPPPREPLAPHNRDGLSYAATVLPHVSEAARSLSAAQLHNTLVAPFASPNSPPKRAQRPSYEYADHPYRRAAPASFLADFDDEDDDYLSMNED